MEDGEKAKLQDTLLLESVIDKKSALLFSAPSRNLKKIRGFFKSVKINAPIEIDLTQSINDFVSAVGECKDVGFVLCCIDKNDINDIIPKLSFATGHFGKENVCIIFKEMNLEISAFAKSIGVPFDTYTGLGL
jgi:hypothetical protein